MARAFKPNDLQLILLSTASRREGGHLLPLPDSVGAEAERTAAAIAALLKNDLVSEEVTGDPAIAWRENGDQHYSVIIADAGRAIIADEVSTGSVPFDTPSSIPTSAKAPTKIAQVVDLLRREAGATLAELADATGWLPHTTRAALTGLRKKGHAIEKQSRNKVTHYRIAEAA